MSKWQPAPFSGRGITRRFDDTKIMAALTTFVSQVAERARQNASWSSDIPKSIKVGVVTKMSSGNFKMPIMVDLDIAPQALAFEYGSGVHRTKGTPGTYVIRPKNKQVLAFNWEGHGADYPTGNKYVGTTPDGRLMFRFVDHPGVAPKPFIKPAVAYERSHLKADMAKAFKDAIMAGIVKREVIRAT